MKRTRTTPTDADIMQAIDVADLLGLSIDTVYEGAARGEIPHRRVGRRFLFSRRALEAWIHGAGAPVADLSRFHDA